jgi:hypothetical protein
VLITTRRAEGSYAPVAPLGQGIAQQASEIVRCTECGGRRDLLEKHADHSRLAYSEVLPDEKGATCAAFLARAACYFAAHGILRIERIMIDNAWAYRWSLRAVVAALGTKQVFIKRHCPWQNGRSAGCHQPDGQVHLAQQESGVGLPPLLPGSKVILALPLLLPLLTLALPPLLLSGLFLTPAPILAPTTPNLREDGRAERPRDSEERDRQDRPCRLHAPSVRVTHRSTNTPTPGGYLPAQAPLVTTADPIRRQTPRSAASTITRSPDCYNSGLTDRCRPPASPETGGRARWPFSQVSHIVIHPLCDNATSTQLSSVNDA